MNITKKSPGLLMTLLSCLIFFISSCAPINKLKFVADAGPGSITNAFRAERSEKTIQPYDYLYIKIFSLDEKTNSIFNERYFSVENELLSYVVDNEGIITLPFIGNIYVKDMTINEARVTIEQSFEKYLNDISIVVRFVSNKVTLLGEVAAPGQHAFYDEKITVFQAIGYAGGTTTFGDLSTVTLVREKDNVITYYYLDLTKKNIASSEYYYLLPNDVLVINPIKAKYRELRDYALTLTASVLTSISAVLSIILITRSL
ncbi:MAG: polysaccharide biosynthesis/export family protein [Bacteroidales bacterium]|nr:polysaccharide biosynthesis/export family protein [Bacteroidales bacterium]